MALQILREKIPASDIPRVHSAQYVVALRRSALKAAGIRIPAVYEALAQVTGNYFD
jgi:hypothetical protein